MMIMMTRTIQLCIHPPPHHKHDVVSVAVYLYNIKQPFLIKPYEWFHVVSVCHCRQSIFAVA